MPKKKTKAQSIAKEKATILHSKIIRSIGKCEFCGETSGVQFQAAHIISRKFGNTRTDFRNALCLCASCHRKGHDNPLDFAKLVLEWAKVNGIDTDKTRERAYTYNKMDWVAELERLKNIKELVDKGNLTVHELRVL